MRCVGLTALVVLGGGLQDLVEDAVGVESVAPRETSASRLSPNSSCSRPARASVTPSVCSAGALVGLVVLGERRGEGGGYRHLHGWPCSRTRRNRDAAAGGFAARSLDRAEC